MSILKKSMCTFLAVILAFSCFEMSAENLGDMIVNASAATSAADVDTLLADSSVNTVFNTATSSGNVTNVTGASADAISAADAVFDYAVNTLREGTGSTSTNNATSTISADAQAASDYDDILNKLINDGGTTVYGYENRVSKTGSWSGGDQVNDGGYKEMPTGNYQYSTAVSDSVTKITNVSGTLSDNLKSCSDYSSLPDTIVLARQYKYNMGYARNQWCSNKRCDVSYYIPYTIFYIPVYVSRCNWTTEKWNYITSVSQTDTATASSEAIKAYGDFVTGKMVGNEDES